MGDCACVSALQSRVTADAHAKRDSARFTELVGRSYTVDACTMAQPLTDLAKGEV